MQWIKPILQSFGLLKEDDKAAAMKSLDIAAKATEEAADRVLRTSKLSEEKARELRHLGNNMRMVLNNLDRFIQDVSPEDGGKC